MNRHLLTGRRLLVLCLLGLLALNFPMLGLFSRVQMVAGIPLLYVYLFLGWALLIALMALVVEA